MIGGTTMPFDKNMFSDPAMRPHLEGYYEASYEAMHARVAEMRAAEAAGEAPQTVRAPDGREATALGAEFYEKAIPSFDKWLEMQQHFSPFDFAEQAGSHLEQARENMARYERDMGPDEPSGVRTVFADGDRILGYINADGGVVSHEGGHKLRKFAERADEMNLTGAAKIAYITQEASAYFAGRSGDFAAITYDDRTMPTRRAFAAQWYPHHDVDAAYNDALQGIRDHLENMEAWHKQQMENLNRMRAFLMESLAEAEAA